ncbi:MAG TPA: CPBP family intramembrane glutamic endopeptidase [Candidatus Dormibacteraeota bacterium]|nr:CPBP family intramembrane glutamic endopeptidase [Candidatus Dormibacteraeota bacterium]
MITARPAAVRRAPALVAAVSAAAAFRAVAGGPSPAASAPAAVLFTVLLTAAAVWGGTRLGVPSWRGVALGAAGGAALVAVSWLGAPALVAGPRAATSTLLWWAPLVTMVAAAEELVLRGVLFEALGTRFGDVVAVVATALLFGVIHLPLYGAAALPLDLCAGVLLGCLRVASGGVTAPLLAHVLADLSTGWLG